MSGSGTFLLTFDTELIWGLFFDRRWRERAEARHRRVREVFPRILELLAEHRVRATFAFVGHLFLDRCERREGRAHPEMVRPEHDCFDGDWYRFDPCTDVARDPLWYGLDLVEAVRADPLGHEIGAHGFSHAFLDGSLELARSEMCAAAEAARAAGVTVRSFVYPRNVVGCTTELAPAGYTCYRARGRPPATRRGRAWALLRRVAGAAPPVGRPRLVDGVVEVPTSVPVLPAVGFRRLIPLRPLIREAEKGLTRARNEESVFHLWTHPHNFVEGEDRMLNYLRRVLCRVAEFRERGEIEILTMREVSA